MAADRTAALLDASGAASPALLATYRTDGSALVSPVWFRFSGGAFEVIAKGDVKLRHLADVTPIREAIGNRYLGVEAGRRFAAQRSTPGVLLRLHDGDPRVWDLAATLPS